MEDVYRSWGIYWIVTSAAEFPPAARKKHIGENEVLKKRATRQMRDG